MKLLRNLLAALTTLLIVGSYGMTASAAAKYPTTLASCMASQGLKLGSVKSRAPLAAKYGIWAYKGSAKQNMELLKNLCPGEDLLGFAVVTDYQKNLSAPMTATQTFIPVTSLLTKDNVTLNMGLLGNQVFLTLEPGATNEEIAVCTGIDATLKRFTPCSRGLAFSGTSTAAVTANQKTHNSGGTVVMSNVHYIYQQLLDLDGSTQTVTSTVIFNTLPRASSTTAVPTNNAQFGTKYYIDNTLSTGFSSANVSSTLGLIAITSGFPACQSAATCVGVNPSSTGGIGFDTAGLLAFKGLVNTSTILNAPLKVNASSTFNATSTFLFEPMRTNGGMVAPPIGSLMPFAATSAPTGWLIADGSAVSRVTYGSLFAVISTQYGNGDGSTSFNLPDLRGRTVHGTSSTVPVYDQLGETAGSSTHIMTVAEMPAHTHASIGGGGDSGGSGSDLTNTAVGSAQNTTSAGGSQAFDIKDPYIVMPWIIKY